MLDDRVNFLRGPDLISVDDAAARLIDRLPGLSGFFFASFMPFRYNAATEPDGNLTIRTMKWRHDGTAIGISDSNVGR